MYLKEVSRNVVNTKASTAFVQRLIVAFLLLASIRVVYIALATAKRSIGGAPIRDLRLHLKDSRNSLLSSLGRRIVIAIRISSFRRLRI